METRLTINFQTSPEQYKHWRLAIDGPVASGKSVIGRRIAETEWELLELMETSP